MNYYIHKILSHNLLRRSGVARKCILKKKKKKKKKDYTELSERERLVKVTTLVNLSWIQLVKDAIQLYRPIVYIKL